MRELGGETGNWCIVRKDADLKDALELMKKERVRRLPVIDHDRLLGMVSLGDLAVYGNTYDTEISEALTEISIPSRPTNL